MKQYFEFRIPEDRAAKVLSPRDGVVLGGTVRKLVLESTDSRLTIVEHAEGLMRAKGQYFSTSGGIRRRYTRAELDGSLWLRLQFSKVFEPAGEMAGTTYDEQSSCSSCGAGAVQTSALVLPGAKLPKSRQFGVTIAGEIVASQRVAAPQQRLCPPPRPATTRSVSIPTTSIASSKVTLLD